MLTYVASFTRLVRIPASNPLRTISTSIARSARPVKTSLPQAPKKTAPAAYKSKPSLNDAAESKRSRFTSTSLQQYRAQQLYDNGVRQIYKEPGATRIYVAWILGGCCLLYAVNLFSLRHWDSDTLIGMGPWQKAFVSGGNRVGMFLLSTAGGFIIFRYTGFIRSIRLVNTPKDGVKFDIHMRRRVPWSGTRYTVDPGDVLMPKGWHRGIVPVIENGPISLSRAPMTWLRSWFSMEGVVTPVRLSQNTSGCLDASGAFDVSLNDFSAMTSENRL